MYIHFSYAEACSKEEILRVDTRLLVGHDYFPTSMGISAIVGCWMGRAARVYLAYLSISSIAWQCPASCVAPCSSPVSMGLSGDKVNLDLRQRSPFKRSSAGTPRCVALCAKVFAEHELPISTAVHRMHCKSDVVTAIRRGGGGRVRTINDQRTRGVAMNMAAPSEKWLVESVMRLVAAEARDPERLWAGRPMFCAKRE